MRATTNPPVDATDAAAAERLAATRIRRRHDRWFRYGTLMPAVIILVVLTAFPVANLLRMAVSTIDFTAAGAVYRFTPAENFRRLLHTLHGHALRAELGQILLGQHFQLHQQISIHVLELGHVEHQGLAA